MAGDDALLFRLEQQWRDDRERVRALLREEGREDLIAEYDAKMRDMGSGVENARSIWHSISDAQRRALELAGAGYGRTEAGVEARAALVAALGGE